MSERTEKTAQIEVKDPKLAPPKSMGRIVWEQFCENKMAVASAIIISLFVAIALGADLISAGLGIDPDAQDVFNRYAGPSAAHWLGTDELGRDVLVRLVYGTRISLLVAFLVAFTSMIFGIAVGAIAGYFGGTVDTILMRIVDSMLALPLIPILIILARVDLDKIPLIGSLMVGESASIIKMVLILMAFSWMVQARLVRGEILAIKEREFVLAAQTSGMSSAGVIVREILPNVLSPVIVAVTLNVGGSILFEAALSFLGLGIQPPTPSWGNMLNNAQEIINSAPMLAVLPGLLILIVVVSFNFLGDGLQAAMDPKAIRR
jgi:peptide/nickel transport system permease protein